MTDLSPAALAVLDAYSSGFHHPVAVHHKPRIAAALRAAADQVAPREPAKDPLWASAAYRQRADIRAHILAIADELEGSND